MFLRDMELGFHYAKMKIRGRLQKEYAILLPLRNNTGETIQPELILLTKEELVLRFEQKDIYVTASVIARF